MVRATLLVGGLAALGIGLGVGVARATELQVNPELGFQGNGVNFVIGGVGLENLGAGTENLSVDIGGPVLKAYLYWAGRDHPCPLDAGECVITEPYLDQELVFDSNPLTGVLVGAEKNIRLNLNATNNNIGYGADVTDIVRAKGSGPQTFTIQDGNLGSNFGNGFNGASLLVIYQDETDTTPYRVIVYDGLDFAFSNATPDAAKVAQPVAFAYLPTDNPRSGQLVVCVGDAESARPDRIDISDNPSQVNQLDSSQGASWDADEFTISIPIGAGTTLVEVVSPQDLTNSDSLLWELAVLRLPINCVPGEECDDGNACTVEDICTAQGECVGRTVDPEVDCDDGNACTLESCDPATGCVYTPDEGATCSDGDACTTDDTCDENGQCVGTPIDPLVVCEDNNPCTIDTCDPNLGCVNTPDEGATCDDGDACTPEDICDENGQCVGTIIDPGVLCDDGNACTADTCDPQTGCHSKDTTPSGFCCDPLTGDLTAIDDGDPCTEDICHEDGTVTHDDCVVAIVVGAGMRTIHVTVPVVPPGSMRMVALRITSPNFSCWLKYIDADGNLVDEPVFRPLADWGTVVVTGPDIIPRTRKTPIIYEVGVICNDQCISEPGWGGTGLWADVRVDGRINLLDFLCVVNAFAGEFDECTLEDADLMPCEPDGVINVFDLLAVLNSFGGDPFPCAIPCGGACCAAEPYGRCLMLASDVCLARNGEPQGVGTICDPSYCLIVDTQNDEDRSVSGRRPR